MNTQTLLNIYLICICTATTVVLFVSLYIVVRSLFHPGNPDIGAVGLASSNRISVRNNMSGIARNIKRSAELQTLERIDRMSHADKEPK